MEKNQQSTAEQYSEQIEQLMELGRTQGYLTFAEINDLLPEDAIDPEYYDKLLQTLQNDAGIPVLEQLILLLVKMKSALQNVLKRGLMKFKPLSQPILKH